MRRFQPALRGEPDDAFVNFESLNPRITWHRIKVMAPSARDGFSIEREHGTALQPDAMRTRKKSNRTGFHRRSMMKVALTLTLVAGVCVLFIVLKAGRIHHHGARPGSGITANDAASSTPSASREVFVDSSSSTASERTAGST